MAGHFLRMAAVGLCLAAAARAEGPPARRGPLEARDEWLLAQPRLSLGPASPDPLAPGETRVRIDLDWGTSFGLQLGPARRLPDPSFVVDGENRTLGIEVRRGVSPSLTVGARLPVKWRGGGVLDSLVDGFHALFGLPDNGRTLLPRDQLRVAGRDGRSDLVQWTGGDGVGLGNLELSVLRGLRWSRTAWSLGAVARASLPTATGPFGGAGAGVGGQIVFARPVGRALDVYLGLGGTLHFEAEAAGVRYPRGQAQGFAAVEWRPGPRLSLLAQANASSRLVSDLPEARRLRVELRVGSKIDVGERWRLEIGVTEGLENVDSTTDFGLLLGVARRF